MDHPEREDEIDPSVDSKRFRGTQLQCDPLSETFPIYAPLEPGKHLFLNIDGNDASIGANHLRHGNRKVAHSRSNVQSRVSIVQVRSKDDIGVLNKPSEDVVKGEAEPPWADVGFSKEKNIQ
jgi:hypothetical protein